MTDAAAIQPDPTSPRRSQSTWMNLATSMAALLIAVGTLLGICLHLTGHVAHITELRSWGVQSDLFPRPSEWTMINGYYAIFFETTRTLSDMPWALVVTVCLAIAFLILIYRLPPPKKRAPILDRFPNWLKSIISAVTLSALWMTTIFYLLLVALMIAIIPAVVGERAGKHSADEALASYRSSKSFASRAELWRGEELLMQGHIIAVSSDLIALFDTDLDQARTIDRAGIEIRTRPKTSVSKKPYRKQSIEEPSTADALETTASLR
ncbi:hypothetical protein [Luteimonas fraxinea]|uniref:hypothetical protein n=1 Tax=Luteimonas fraxinea TaxID=2901869 RepID=UPI001E419556|nr:hypothetical protein [Luteimonas fraxinea]MCD9125399.1 hypothetical protein [Luteimonas fraxinea]